MKLFESFFDEGCSETHRVNWRITKLRQYVRDRSNVVEVAMRKKHTTDFAFALLEVLRVRNDIVYAWHGFIGESKSHVDDDDIIAILEYGHIFTHFLYPSDRDDAKCVRADPGVNTNLALYLLASLRSGLHWQMPIGSLAERCHYEFSKRYSANLAISQNL